MKQKIFPIYLQSRDTFEQVKRVDENEHAIIVCRTGLNGYAKSLEMKVPTSRFDKTRFEDKDDYIPSSEYNFLKFSKQYGEHVAQWTKKILENEK